MYCVAFFLLKLSSKAVCSILFVGTFAWFYFKSLDEWEYVYCWGWPYELKFCSLFVILNNILQWNHTLLKRFTIFHWIDLVQERQKIVWTLTFFYSTLPFFLNAFYSLSIIYLIPTCSILIAPCTHLHVINKCI